MVTGCQQPAKDYYILVEHSTKDQCTGSRQSGWISETLKGDPVTRCHGGAWMMETVMYYHDDLDDRHHSRALITGQFQLLGCDCLADTKVNF